MRVIKEAVGNANVVTLKGEFDSFTSSAFMGELQKIYETGVFRIVLNMRLVKFVNSTALGALIKSRKACRAMRGDVVISQPSSAVRESFSSLGLDRLFSIFDSDEEALKSLTGGEAEEHTIGSDERAVMIGRLEGGRPLVGRMHGLTEDSIECRVAVPRGDVQRFYPGEVVSIKFRLALYRKKYFEFKGRVDNMILVDDGMMKIVFSFLEGTSEDRADIRSFVADLQELREAARDRAFEETLALDVAPPLSIYFDESEFELQEIAAVISELSRIYAGVGGDRLIIDRMLSYDTKHTLSPAGS